jgi:hypothetical protein
MALNINQFKQSTTQGDLDLQFAGTVFSCMIDASQSTALVAGQAVKLATTSGGVPKVVALTAATDPAFGFVVRNLKDPSLVATQMVEVAHAGSVMTMTAGAAITRGKQVEVVTASNKVITSAGVNAVVGTALDTATADGDLIRVLISSTSASDQSLKTAIVTATLAEINAGKTLIAGVSGKAITVIDYKAQVTGTFATGTAALLQSSNGTPVVVSTLAEAGLSAGAVLGVTSANTTLGAGFAAALGAGDGLVVANSGSAQTGGTSIKFTITYKQA